MSRTGIICTIGPSTESASVLAAMMDAGMNVARLNCSHGSHDEHKSRIDTIRRLNSERSGKVKILLDLEGFRVRVGAFSPSLNKQMELTEGSSVYLTNSETSTGPTTIPLDYKESLNVLSPGDLIHIDDGSISLQATEVADDSVKCVVVIPGIVKEHKGVNIPNARFPFEGITEKDRSDIQFGIENEVDFIAQSFVRSKQDIIDIREITAASDFECKLVAKIENIDGIRNLKEILDVVDGIMIARGDLGVSLPIYEVPVLQKILTRESMKRSKLVITATQMLESMTNSPRPTRAEVSDVANAVLDNSDYVMLSGETAVGRYPVEVVRMMREVVDFAERFPSLGYFTG